MNKLILLNFFIIFIFSCNQVEQSLPDGITGIEARFSNMTLGPEHSSSYNLTFDLNANNGVFNVYIPAQSFDNAVQYTVNLELTSEDLLNIREELAKLKFKFCTDGEMLTGAVGKSITFSKDDDEYNVYSENDICTKGKDKYYFTSSTTSLYELFEDIILEHDTSSLPEDWENYI